MPGWDTCNIGWMNAFEMSGARGGGATDDEVLSPYRRGAPPKSGIIGLFQICTSSAYTKYVRSRHRAARGGGEVVEAYPRGL